jgi:hypothetical protein
VHALLAGLIGVRGETIEDTVELVRQALGVRKAYGLIASDGETFVVTADEIRARHASLEDWKRKVTEGTFAYSGYRVDLAAYRIAVKQLEEAVDE